MNQGFGSYFRSGWRASFRVFHRKAKTLIIYLFYYLASLLGRLFFFSRPLFESASLNLAEMSEKSGDFLVSKSFEGVNQGKRYKTLLLFDLVFDLFLLAGLLLLGGISVGLFFFGYYLGATPLLSYTMAFCLAAPLWLLALAFLFSGLFFASFAASIVRDNPEIELSDLFYNCMLSFKKKGKGALFLLHFLYDLFVLLYLGLSVFVPYLLLSSSNIVLRIVGAFSILILALVFLFFSPYLHLARQVSLYLYKKDQVESQNYRLYQEQPSTGGKKVVEVFSPLTQQSERKVLYPSEQKENRDVINGLYQQAGEKKNSGGNAGV